MRKLTRRLAVFGGLSSLVAPAVASPDLQRKRPMTDDDLLSYLDPLMTHYGGIGSAHALPFNRLLSHRLGMSNVFPDGTLFRARLDALYTLEVARDGGPLTDIEEKELIIALNDAFAEEISELPEFSHLVALIPSFVICPISCNPQLRFRIHYLSS